MLIQLDVEQLELKIEEKFNVIPKITIEASQIKVNKGEPIYLHMKAYDINDYMEDIKIIKNGIAS